MVTSIVKSHIGRELIIKSLQMTNVPMKIYETPTTDVRPCRRSSYMVTVRLVCKPSTRDHPWISRTQVAAVA
jgi:hypothetical protein